MKHIERIKYLAGLCVEVSLTTEHDVFFEYAAHVSGIEIRVFEGGWGSKLDCTGDNAYLSWEDFEQRLDRIIEIVENLKGVN